MSKKQRKLQIAKRCQLIIGSFEGSTLSCPCLSPKGCRLTASERVRFLAHSDVAKAKELNLKEFKRNKSCQE